MMTQKKSKTIKKPKKQRQANVEQILANPQEPTAKVAITRHHQEPKEKWFDWLFYFLFAGCLFYLFFARLMHISFSTHLLCLRICIVCGYMFISIALFCKYYNFSIWLKRALIFFSLGFIILFVVSTVVDTFQIDFYSGNIFIYNPVFTSLLSYLALIIFFMAFVMSFFIFYKKYKLGYKNMLLKLTLCFFLPAILCLKETSLIYKRLPITLEELDEQGVFGDVLIGG